MQKLTIRLSENEYIIMQTHAKYWQSWCFGHFKHKLSRGLDPEIIAAVMYEKYFEKDSSSIKFPKSGKAFFIEYYEAKAFVELICVAKDMPTQGVRVMLLDDMNNWKPSLSKLNMEQWYNTQEAMIDTFGEFDLLDDVQFEVVNSIYNQQELLV